MTELGYGVMYCIASFSKFFLIVTVTCWRSTTPTLALVYIHHTDRAMSVCSPNTEILIKPPVLFCFCTICRMYFEKCPSPDEEKFIWLSSEWIWSVQRLNPNQVILQYPAAHVSFGWYGDTTRVCSSFSLDFRFLHNEQMSLRGTIVLQWHCFSIVWSPEVLGKCNTEVSGTI